MKMHSQCQAHTGELDDDWNPVDFRGEPFMPGVRECGRKDCVNPAHLRGWVPPTDDSPAREPKKLGRPRSSTPKPPRIQEGPTYQERILEAATEGVGNSRHKLRPGILCNMADCLAPYRAKGLCSTHYAVYRRIVSPELIKPIRRFTTYTAADFAGVTYKQRQEGPCVMADCDREMFAHSLCRNHFKVWRKFIKGEKR